MASLLSPIPILVLLLSVFIPVAPFRLDLTHIDAAGNFTNIPVAPFRLDLTHIDAAGNFTKLELFSRAVLRSKHRLITLTKTGVPVHSSNGEYLLDLAIGTPARKFSAILDTGSDLIWTQCSPCIHCFPQPTPLFRPSQSSTWSKLPCKSTLCKALPTKACIFECIYVYGYGDGSSTEGVLASEKFTFGSQTVQLGFGCGVSNQGDFANASGLVGFGRGPLSLISQLGVGEFSYCFTTLSDAKQSPLFLGFKSNSSTVIEKSTPLLNTTSPTNYYLSLLGITVGETRLRIPTGTFEVKEDGSGGLIIDSGTPVTQLETAAYKLVRKEFLRQVKLPLGNASLSSDGFDLCFSLPAVSKEPELPKMVFHFEGADWEMTRENYMVHDSGLLCLTIIEGDGMSVFGNLQQQNTYIRYDLKEEKLWFAPTRCDLL